MTNIFDLRQRALNWLTDAETISEEFRRNGVVVIENVLTDAEVDLARQSLHDQLKSNGVDHEKIMTGAQSPDGVGVRIKSPAASFFYSLWKLNVAMHPRIVESLAFLFCETFANIANEDENEEGEPLYASRFGRFDSMFHYVDRVCYRLPDVILFFLNLSQSTIFTFSLLNTNTVDSS